MKSVDVYSVYEQTFETAREHENPYTAVEAAATWDALLSFQERRRIAGHMLEIGVRRGKSAALLGLHADPTAEICVLVDKYLALEPVKEAMRQVRPDPDASCQFVRADSRPRRLQSIYKVFKQ